MQDSYTTISEGTEGEFKDKGSKFLAYAYPVSSVSKVEDYLNQLKKLHPKSRHLCYAWSMGAGENQYRTQDDGEPSGTAGKPILGQIRSFGFSDILIVVVRYFGGTLLGTSGLIQAYRESAKDALEKAKPLQVYISDTLQITAEYQHDKKVQQVFKQYELIPINAAYETAITWTVMVRKTKTNSLITDIKSVIGGISKEQAADTDSIPGLSIKQI
jgi:uncharacterized YigZ family protein